MTAQLHTETARRTQMRRTRTRTAKAQNAAFGMSTTTSAPPCSQLGPQWHSSEREVVALLGRRLDIEALDEAEALTSSCSHCPLRTQCADWGRTDRYTGVAGGLVLRRGEQVHRS